MNKTILLTLILLMSSCLGFSQLFPAEDNIEGQLPNRINGPNKVATDEISVYTFNFDGAEQWRWTVHGGIILRSSKKEIVVKWISKKLDDKSESTTTTALLDGLIENAQPLPINGINDSSSSNNIEENGSISISVAYQKNTILTPVYKSINVNIAYNPIPKIPIIKRENCNEIILQKLPETHPDIVWYWQGKNPQGTSIANNSTTYRATQSGTYYLRGYNRKAKKFSIRSIPFEVQLKKCGNYISEDENFIHTTVYKKPYKENEISNANTDDKINQTTYYDALGRPKQIVNVKAGGNKNDIITHIEYDSQGRKEKEYLPYTDGNTNAGYRNNNTPLVIQNYYKNKFPEDFGNSIPTQDINAYAQKAYDNSPLNRIMQQASPGNDWKIHGGHTIDFNYEFNTIEDRVKKYKVSLTKQGQLYQTKLENKGNYTQGELYKNTIRDENHDGTNSKLHTIEEFKNKQGQVILKRTYALQKRLGLTIEEEHDTYYVYDDFGNLTYVISPKVNTFDGVSPKELAELCYQYKYDYRNRLVEKKTPGKGWEYIVYNKIDQPVLTQDTNLDNQNKWLFTKYDVFGRVTYTGYAASNSSRAAVEVSALSNSYTQIEKRTDKQRIANVDIHYSNTAIPRGVSSIYTINYYDDYNVDLPSGLGQTVTTSYGQRSTTRTKGLATVSKTRVLTTSHFITTVTYYDEKARPIYVYTQNPYLQTIDIVESKLDFTGKVLETKTTHKKTGKSDIITVDRFDYDHQDRLVEQNKKINNQIPERIVKNNYNDLGELQNKILGNGTKKGYKDVTNGISINKNVITKVSGNGWAVGLATRGTINKNGYVEFTAGSNNTPMMIGLSRVNTNAHYSTIDYAIYLYWSKRLIIYEKGRHKGEYDKFEIGDTFKVERIGNTIYYKKNGEIFYISESQSSGNLLGDISLHTNGAKIKDFKIVDNSKGLQKVDYKYNVRGWLKNINQDTFNDNDLFNFSIKYNDVSIPVKQRLYNGNISQTVWQTLNVNRSTKTYNYTYDALNRIKSAIGTNTSNYNVSGITYDKNGNIKTLNRKGHINSRATSFGNMDLLSYTYDSGNKLLKVKDAGNKTYGFKDGANTTTEYTYDANGNLKTDANKKITSIAYNHLNLPTQITINGKAIHYIYDAVGTKLRKKVNNTITDYAGNHIYKNNTLELFNHSEGYVKNDNGTFNYAYQYKDHLGNVRLSYTDANNDGRVTQSEIIEESNYYPFGLKHKGYNTAINGVHHKYEMYNGKEYEETLGLNLYEMDLRSYDPTIGRFNGIDPVTHFSQGTSVAFDNNPVYWADPSGADSQKDVFGRNRYDENGNYIPPDRRGYNPNAIIDTDEGGNDDNTPNNNGFVKIGEGRYYNKAFNIYLNINNSQKMDKDTFGYVISKIDLSFGPQTKEGGTLFGFGTKSNISFTTSIGSIEIMTSIDKTIVNIAYLGKDIDTEKLMKLAVFTVDINRGILGGSFSRNADQKINIGANLGPLKVYNGDTQILALKLIEYNVSFIDIGGVDISGVSGNVEFRFNRPFYNDKKKEWDYGKFKLNNDKKKRIYFRR